MRISELGKLVKLRGRVKGGVVTPSLFSKTVRATRLHFAIAVVVTIAINLVLPNTLQLLANLPILGSSG